MNKKPIYKSNLNKCKIPGCDNFQKGKRLCTGHLQRLELWGDPKPHIPFQGGNKKPRHELLMASNVAEAQHGEG